MTIVHLNGRGADGDEKNWILSHPLVDGPYRTSGRALMPGLFLGFSPRLKRDSGIGL